MGTLIKSVRLPSWPQLLQLILAAILGAASIGWKVRGNQEEVNQRVGALEVRNGALIKEVDDIHSDVRLLVEALIERKQ